MTRIKQAFAFMFFLLIWLAGKVLWFGVELCVPLVRAWQGWKGRGK